MLAVFFLTYGGEKIVNGNDDRDRPERDQPVVETSIDWIIIRQLEVGRIQGKPEEKRLQGSSRK